MEKINLGKDEELYEVAKDIVIDAGYCTTSLIQRRLGLGYARAARIVDALEERGIVGEPVAGKRKVLVQSLKPVSVIEKQEKSETALDEELKVPGTVECKLELETLTLKKKTWTCVIVVKERLAKTYYNYHVHLDLNERIWLEVIDNLHNMLNGTLFKSEKTSEADVNRRIEEQEELLRQNREKCEHIEFVANTQKVLNSPYDTTLTMIVPDDIIEALNRQKYNFDIYKIKLVPIQ